MKTKIAIYILSLAAVAAVMIGGAAGQSQSVFKITVLDPAGAGIPGAMITLIPDSTRIPYVPARTDARGKMEIDELPAGKYQVRVEAWNLRTNVFTDVILLPAKTYEITAKLERGSGPGTPDIVIGETKQFATRGDDSFQPILEERRPDVLKLEVSVANNEEHHGSTSDEEFRFTFRNGGKEDMVVNLGHRIDTYRIPSAIVLVLTDGNHEIRRLEHMGEPDTGAVSHVASEEYPVPVKADSSVSISTKRRDYWSPNSQEMLQSLPAGTYSLRAEFTGTDFLAPYYRENARFHPMHYWIGRIVSNSLQIVLPTRTEPTVVK